MTAQRLEQVSGSNREPLEGARRVADAAPDDEVMISIVVRRKDGGAEKALEAAGSIDPQTSRPDRRRLAEQAGADPADIERVKQYVTAHGMEVVTYCLTRSM